MNGKFYKRICWPQIMGITGYHYTNLEAYRSMQTKGLDGFITLNFEDFAGLIPRKRFVKLGEGNGLPERAHDAIVEGLLEPEPDCWLKNPEFPHLWRYLMHDICRGDVLLLSFELLPKDEVYVVDRAHVERELYRESKGLGKSTRETRNVAFRKYWESRVPVFEYSGGYDVPQLATWSGIEFERLNVEWQKPHREVWDRVLDNDW